MGIKWKSMKEHLEKVQMELFIHFIYHLLQEFLKELPKESQKVLLEQSWMISEENKEGVCGGIPRKNVWENLRWTFWNKLETNSLSNMKRRCWRNPRRNSWMDPKRSPWLNSKENEEGVL